MNIEIANKLLKLRKENGYSQEELADKLGVSRQAVSKWERAESSPDTDNLIILARLYNVSLDELLSDSESDEEIRERTMDKENDTKDSSSIKLTDDEGQTLEINGGHIHAYKKDGTEVFFNKKRAKIISIADSIIALSTLIAYLTVSFITNAWYITLIMWVAMPAVMSIVEAIVKKQLSKFLYPVAITAVYLFLGMQYGYWHPHWILFVTIPVFYVIVEPIDKYVFKTKNEDDDDDDED